MTSLKVCSAAEAEYTKALCWYAERNEAAATDFDSEFDRACAAIAKDPERYPKCDERHRFYLMRRFPYQIIYRIVRAQVIVIAVAHTSRSPHYWTER